MKQATSKPELKIPEVSDAPANYRQAEMFMDTRDIIAAAIEHLRTPAMDRAEQQTRAMAEQYRITLEAADWDLNVAYPYPNSGMGRANYQQALGRRNMAQRLARQDDARTGTRLRQSDPLYRTWEPDEVERLVKQARELASLQYDQFIAKLAGKVEQDGPVVEAVLTGEHVWGRSTLTVVHADGSTHQWHTSMIINVSKLGTLFNQWPTRKAKPAKRKARAPAPVHPEGWKCKGGSGDFVVWHVGPMDYRVTQGTGEVLGCFTNLSTAFTRAMRLDEAVKSEAQHD
ncbi:hypothetical protein ACEUCJ_15290 [Aeromonas rivipollensis]|uniref:hypothetical protein n=1 Tax=Aeromonas rivipollensis TaxID=948519 RepID=UPI0038D215C2